MELNYLPMIVPLLDDVYRSQATLSEPMVEDEAVDVDDSLHAVLFNRPPEPQDGTEYLELWKQRSATPMTSETLSVTSTQVEIEEEPHVAETEEIVLTAEPDQIVLTAEPEEMEVPVHAPSPFQSPLVKTDSFYHRFEEWKSMKPGYMNRTESFYQRFEDWRVRTPGNLTKSASFYSRLDDWMRSTPQMPALVTRESSSASTHYDPDANDILCHGDLKKSTELHEWIASPKKLDSIPEMLEKPPINISDKPPRKMSDPKHKKNEHKFGLQKYLKMFIK